MNSLLSRSNLLSPLSERRFRLFWIGESVSLLGDQVYRTALPFLVFGIGGTPEQLSLAFVFYFVPQIVFVLLGGVVVDRFSRRGAMLLTDAGHVLVLAAVVGLLLAGELHVWHVWALAACFGAFSAFFMPASKGIIPDLVPGERLVPANSLYSVSEQVDSIIGPAIGGALVAGGSVAAALGLDGFTFTVSGLCLLGLGSVRQVRSPESGKPGYLHELREGFGIVRSSQWLWATIALFSLVNVFFGGAVEVALPTLARQDLGGAASFGWMMSGMAAGAVAAALLLGRMGRLPRRGVLAYAGLLASGVMLAGVGVVQSTAQAVAVALLFGPGLAVFDVVWSSTLQEMVPREALGRVVSIDMLGSFCFLPVGYLIAGPMVSALGPRTDLLIAGAGITALALLGLSLRSVRELR